MSAALVLGVLACAAPAAADHPQSPPDVSKMDYAPIGHFKPGQAVPAPNSHATSMKPLMQGRRFNPSGKYNAFDTNVFEITSLPFRAAGDTKDDDPYGNGGDPRHGYCAQPHNPVTRPGNAALLPGVCPNHQLEYGLYFEETMKEILGDFGVTIRRYEFHNPGSDNTLPGRAINVAAVVPGADHPEETVIVGAHYDQTNDGPASAWDSQEGHAQIIRMAKIMSDYWRSTGTRPSATVKFIPWDAEESGTLGSRDYAQNVIVPGEESKVRSYWNTDPCAGGYPAYRYGNPADRIDLGVQIADPAAVTVNADRIKAFNATARTIVEQVFENLDDTLTLDAGKRNIFIATSEANATDPADIGRDVLIGTSRPVLFSSDWRNFEVLGIPFFNPGPEITGPDNQNGLGNPDGIAILHTPNDNQLTLNRLTGPGPSNADGSKFSEGWMKGMEMCAHLLAWGMLQPNAGGAQTADDSPVSYYEALPNEAVQNQVVRFDADGTYRYASSATRSLADASTFEYSWDFGDGTTGTGRRVEHRYGTTGRFTSKLTVRDPVTGKTDTMTVPVTVIPSNFNGPFLEKPPAEDEDGSFLLEYGFAPSRDGFQKFVVERAPDFRTLARDQAEGDIAAQWNVVDPTNPEIAPWQRSDSAARKFRGNQKAEGATSYWTGVEPSKFKASGVQQGKSELVLKAPVKVPATGSPTLSYFSLFQNEGDDRGLVEVAVDDGDPATEPEFKPVDEIFAVSTALGGPPDSAICNPSEPATFTEPLRERAADLSGFRGKDVLVRFTLVLGPENRALSQPCGWYIDDIRVRTGTFAPIGETPADKTTFDVKGLTAGDHAFRVKGLYADGVETAPSNTETVRVTKGAPAPPSQPGGSQPGGTNPGPPATTQPSPTCDPSSGFSRATVRRAGRGLRFEFTRATRRRTTVDVFQVSRGSLVIGNRRVAKFSGRRRSFTWNGRSTTRKRLTDGYYFVRYRIRGDDGRPDTRRFTVVRSGGRFRVARRYYDRETCGLVSSFKLTYPAFGGLRNRPLGIGFQLTEPAKVTVTVLRGSRVVRRYPSTFRPAGFVQRLRLGPERLRRGRYTVVLVAESGGRKVTKRLYAQRL